MFIDDEAKGSRKVGTISIWNYADRTTNIVTPKDHIAVVDLYGHVHEVPVEHIVKPLETTPQAMWKRWAYGAALVELDHSGKADFSDAASVATKWEDEFSWLFDGYRYSPGGRIQLGLGHEYLGLPKASLTLSNCYVGPKVECGDSGVVWSEWHADECGAESSQGSCVIDPVDQWRKVLANLSNQIEIQRRGGGYGVNISEIAQVNGRIDQDVVLHVPASHRDADEIDGLRKLGRFDEVRARVGEIEGDDYHVILVPDSIDGIMRSLDEMITKLYGGHDIIASFGQLRPKHAPVSNIGRSSGAASWMTLFALVVRLLRQETIDAVDFAELFAFTTNLVEQGGSRRGALMLVANVDTPWIEKFVVRKREPGRLVGANVSVAVDDAFMGRVKRYEPWKGEDSLAALPAIDPLDREAQRIWRLIVESAHASGEPGVLYVDRINNESNAWYYACLEASNPCGEQPLPPNGACNLGHLVLPRFVKGDWTVAAWKDDPLYETMNPRVDYASLERAVRLAVRFQDDMIVYSPYPTPATKAQQAKERRVGIGTMGLGTLAIMLGMTYGSDEMLAFIDDLYAKIAYWAYDASIDIAAEKGAFPAFEYDKYVQSGFMKRLLAEFPQLDEKLRKHGIRNVTLLTQAPTGTTGTMLDNIDGLHVSTGIEPYYSLKPYFRASRLGASIPQEPKIVEEYRQANGLSPDSPLPSYFVDTSSLPPEAHVRVQATIQRWVDSSISKTINMTADASVDDVAKAYMLGYELGVKGMTVYVDGSRQAQVLASEASKAKLESHIEAEAMGTTAESIFIDDFEFSAKTAETLERMATYEALVNDGRGTVIVKRPRRTFGFTDRLDVLVGDVTSKVYVTVNVDEDGEPFEVFVNANDPAIADVAEALGRMTTQMLRYGGTDDNVAQACKHLRRGQSNMMSLPSQMARLIEGARNVEFPGQTCGVQSPPREGVIPRESIAEIVKSTVAAKSSPCPECGESTVYSEGCRKCPSCGWSKCS